MSHISSILLYALPTVHKDKNPPGRLFVSGIGKLTSHASIMPAKFLKLLDFNILHELSVLTGTLLVSVDVERL